MTSTFFNPFGVHVGTVQSIKTEIEKIEKLIGPIDAINAVDLASHIKMYEKMLEQLTEVSKNIPAHAVQSLLTEIAEPFSKFINVLDKKTQDELKTVNVNVFLRKSTQFFQSISDRVCEPFNSEVLKQWDPLFRALITNRHPTLRENGCLLWKKSFGTIKTPIEWPGDLRSLLGKVPKKHGIYLPPNETPAASSLLFQDDDAMDGLSSNSSKVLEPSQEKTTEESKSSFQFSQQPAADKLADQLLKEKNLKTERISSPNPATTPSRKRASKISLIDEDSCDFVKITTTPPSHRKNRLTDRQKEKLAEASGPKTTINYVDEESQSAFQKTANMKKALSAMNFDVGEDSVSAPLHNSSVTISAVTEKEDNKLLSPVPVSTGRIRKLFCDSPVRALPTTSSYSNSSAVDSTEKSPTSPPPKRVKTTELPADTSDEKCTTEVIKSKELQEEVKECTPQKRRAGRPPKKDSKNSKNPVTPISSRKSSRLMVSTNNSSEVIVEHTTSLVPDVEKTASDVKENGDVKENDKENELKEKEEKGLETKIAESSSHLSAPISTFVKSTTPCEGVDVSNKIDSIASDEEKTPPKTPRTPSILRKAGSYDSPMTERKKNRVHFGEDSIPKDISSPLTPRRRPPSAEKDCVRIFALSDSSRFLSSSMPVSTTEVVFYPSLIDCHDKIDRIIPNMVTLCRKTVVDSAKRSLLAVGVKSVGDFAKLSKSQIEKFTWIKGRTAGAKNALAQYEKTWNSVQQVDGEAEQIVNESPIGLIQDVKSTDAEETETLSADETTAPMGVVQEEISTSSVSQSNPIDLTAESTENCPSKSVTPSLTTHETDDVKTPELMITPKTTPEKSKSPDEPVNHETVPLENVNISSVTTSEEKTIAPAARKNLTPLFVEKTNGLASTNEDERQKLGIEFLGDCRRLYRIYENLTVANSLNQWPAELSNKQIATIRKAEQTFRTLVRSYQNITWTEEDFDYEPSNDVAVDKEIDDLFVVFKRFSRYHTCSLSSSLPWERAMDTINDMTILLEGIKLYRTSNN